MIGDSGKETKKMDTVEVPREKVNKMDMEETTKVEETTIVDEVVEAGEVGEIGDVGVGGDLV
jgi:hypothetical protein